MTRTSMAVGRISTAAPSETDIIFETMPFSGPRKTDGVLWFHGSGETGRTQYSEDPIKAILDELSESSVVIVADFGLQTWANNTVVARAVEAMNYGEANLGVTGKWTLVGASMGNSSSFATAKANPTRVKGITGVIPLMDIVDIMAKGAVAEVNAAYGGTYSDTTDGPNHNPIKMATTIDPTLPIHLWAAPDDGSAPYSIAQNFVSLRPQTGFTTLPNGGHSIASIANAGPEMVEFVRGLAVS